MRYRCFSLGDIFRNELVRREALLSQFVKNHYVQWCVANIFKSSEWKIRIMQIKLHHDPWIYSYRYVRWLIKYHLPIFFVIILFTTLAFPLFFFRIDRQLWKDLLRVNQRNASSSNSYPTKYQMLLFILFLLGVSSSWNKNIRWLPKIDCSFSWNPN